MRLFGRPAGPTPLLVAALGNPGAEYRAHRHSVGYAVADELLARWGWGPYRTKFQGLYADGQVGGERVLLLLPQTFMNRSGDAVAEAARFAKTPPERLLVIHDEVELPFGDVRLKEGGGLGGHNGLRSIEQRLGSRDFWRVRVGVGKDTRRAETLADYVLRPFDEDSADVTAMVDRGADLVEAWVMAGGGEPMAAAPSGPTTAPAARAPVAETGADSHDAPPSTDAFPPEDVPRPRA